MTDARPRIVVVDDDPAVLDFLIETLRDHYDVEGTVSARAALDRVTHTDIDLVVSDVEMTEMRGPDLLEAIHAVKPGQLVLLITGFASTEVAVQMVRAGACDFITKPFKIPVLLAALERALRDRKMRREIVRVRAEPTPDHRLVAVNPAMRAAVGLAHRAVASDAPVLIAGERGVGKGTIARWIHDASARRAGPFLQINCATARAELSEELFGVHRRVDPRAGLFVDAAGGTLFLDDVSELPGDVQTQLLHTLETSRVRPGGAGGETSVDVRVVAATSRALDPLISSGKFRVELMHRLGVVQIDVPPLRDRRDDIPALIQALLQRAPHRASVPMGITEAAVRWLTERDWPGNVRELASALERAVVLADHDTLVLEDVANQPGGSRVDSIHELFVLAADCQLSLAAIENGYIKRVIDSVAGNMSQAARILGIDRRTLYRKLDGSS